MNMTLEHWHDCLQFGTHRASRSGALYANTVQGNVALLSPNYITHLIYISTRQIDCSDSADLFAEEDHLPALINLASHTKAQQADQAEASTSGKTL